jgi:hypothetical protein
MILVTMYLYILFLYPPPDTHMVHYIHTRGIIFFIFKFINMYKYTRMISFTIYARSYRYMNRRQLIQTIHLFKKPIILSKFPNKKRIPIPKYNNTNKIINYKELREIHDIDLFLI